MNNFSVNSHFFAVIENDNRSLQLPLMNLINVISTIIVFILLYAIISRKRKKESQIYQIVLITHCFTLWLSQVYWGSFHSLVFLFPFPGLYGIGYLAPFLSSYVLVIIWIFLFAITVFTMFIILILRLRGVTRKNSNFYFSTTAYSIFSAFFAMYIAIPMPFCWISAGSSISETQDFVRKFYPNATKVLDIPGIFVYTDSWKFHRILVVAMVLLVSGGVLYIFLCQIIIYEIRLQCKLWSEKIVKYHRKALKDTIIQNLLFGTFLAAIPLFQILNAYRDPEVDTITTTIITNAIFVSSPIPYAITIFCQNTQYRQAVITTFRVQPKPPNVGSTIQVSVARPI
ncbi:Serpentine Receptor, class I [Caenorhabditis elegans]|uniref:Serpentine Receptor, class I n=1 Tax=Caenorhabditis elegans TaxID=6239 RepID=O61879_CAEEL|nr:Serpentine Receptor, class I [Caenorhabditis elegans]CCD72120.2 Serpentine Receptor, class I [Caenorhabditis elegans]|eukprot:NP_001317759.1 Uncharacterized protein CELE_F59B1.6 [Caenorhabditis elegans]